MPQENASVEKNARRGTAADLEEVFQTVSKGLSAPAEVENAGRPRRLPSRRLWMAVLVAVLRGRTSQRAIWRVLASGGWWGLPCADSSDHAVSKGLEQEG